MWTVHCLIFLFAFRWLFAKLNAKSPRSTRNRPLPPLSGCHLFSVWKERHQSERAGLGIQMEVPLHQALSCLCTPKMLHLRLMETKHIPILFATPPLPKGSLCSLINVLCFKAGNPGKRNKSLKEKWNHPYIFILLHLYKSCNRK